MRRGRNSFLFSSIFLVEEEKEKEFLIHQAEEENRTISAIVKIALVEKYADKL
jgi:hypothetical protein